MTRNLVTGMGIALISLVLAGCPQQAAVYNVENAAVVANVDNVSAETVRKAIIRAGSGLGWNITDVEPGLLLGTLYLRTHVAKVDIPYTDNNYSILYKDSTNLRYDGKQIHSNYNGWIQNLQKAIQVQLTTL